MSVLQNSIDEIIKYGLASRSDWREDVFEKNIDATKKNNIEVPYKALSADQRHDKTQAEDTMKAWRLSNFGKIKTRKIIR